MKLRELGFWLLDFIAALTSWLLLGIVIPNWNIVVREIQEKYFNKVDKDQ